MHHTHTTVLPRCRTTTYTIATTNYERCVCACAWACACACVGLRCECALCASVCVNVGCVCAVCECRRGECVRACACACAVIGTDRGPDDCAIAGELDYPMGPNTKPMLPLRS